MFDNFRLVLRGALKDDWLLNPILAGASKEADSDSSVSWFFVKKLSKEADSASIGCSIFSKYFFRKPLNFVFSKEADLASSRIDIQLHYAPNTA